METVHLEDRNGLCGFDRFSFTEVKEPFPAKTYHEFHRADLAAIRAIFEVEKKPEYEILDFNDFLDLRTYQDIDMTRGEHLFRLFSGELKCKLGGTRSIYVILRVEAKPGMKFIPKLFARSFPSKEASPGRWMNSRAPWQYIDDSIFTTAILQTTV